MVLKELSCDYGNSSQVMRKYKNNEYWVWLTTRKTRRGHVQPFQFIKTFVGLMCSHFSLDFKGPKPFPSLHAALQSSVHNKWDLTLGGICLYYTKMMLFYQTPLSVYFAVQVWRQVAGWRTRTGINRSLLQWRAFETVPASSSRSRVCLVCPVYNRPFCKSFKCLVALHFLTIPAKLHVFISSLPNVCYLQILPYILKQESLPISSSV